MSDMRSSQLEKTWVVHSFKEKWKISVSLLSFLILLCIGINFLFGSIIFSIISAILLFGSLSNFFLPVRYEFYSDKVVIRTPFQKLSRDWGYFKSCYADKNGILLSPFEAPSRLENYRGVYVRFGKDQAERDGVLELVRGKIKTESPHHYAI